MTTTQTAGRGGWLLLFACSLALAEPPKLSEIPLQDQSLWEAGIIGGGTHIPDYPAAAQRHFKGLAAPYFLYRGKILRADREGTRARFFRTKYVDTELSFGASFSSDSDENDARRGMPDLDYLLEAGPRLSILLSRMGGLGTLRLFLPVRAVFSTDLGNFQHRGFNSTPTLYGRFSLFNRTDTFIMTQLTSTFANRQLSAYFYDVAPEFVRQPDRSFYDSHAGYMGTDLFAGILFPLGTRWRLFAGGQVLFHSGAANQASPLFKNHVNYSAGFGLSWAFYRSTRPAQP